MSQAGKSEGLYMLPVDDPDEHERQGELSNHHVASPGSEIAPLLYNKLCRRQAHKTNEEHIFHQRSKINKRTPGTPSTSKSSDVHTAGDVADG